MVFGGTWAVSANRLSRIASGSSRTSKASRKKTTLARPTFSSHSNSSRSPGCGGAGVPSLVGVHRSLKHTSRATSCSAMSSAARRGS